MSAVEPMRMREGFVLNDEPSASNPEPRPMPQPPAPPAATPPIEQQTAAEPSRPAPIEETWPITVKLLHKAILNNKNEQVREIMLRQPTAADINRYGNPCRVLFDGEVLIDEPKMTRVIAALSGILPPFVETMDPRDWNSCAYRLRGFFLPDPAAW